MSEYNIGDKITFSDIGYIKSKQRFTKKRRWQKVRINSQVFTVTLVS